MSTTPYILNSHRAAFTKHIRIGTGCIIIPYHSPLHVVEKFSLLEALHAGRIDLGMGRAAGTDGLTNAVLRNSNEQLTGDQIMNQLMEILAFFDRDFPEDHPYKDIKVSPDKNLRPELFMLRSE